MKDVTKGFVFYKTPGGEVKVFDPNAKTKKQRSAVQKRIQVYKSNGKLKIKEASVTRKRLHKEFKEIFERKEDTRFAGEVLPSKRDRRQRVTSSSGVTNSIDPYMVTQSVQQEYIKRKAYRGPGTADVSQINDGEHLEEIKTAKWLAKILGGKIKAIREKRKNTDYVKYADLDWDRELWELKTPSSENAIRSRMRDAFDKIYDLETKHMDGIIVNVPKDKPVSKERIVEIVRSSLNEYAFVPMDVIIKNGDDLVDILRIKHKK